MQMKEPHSCRSDIMMFAKRVAAHPSESGVVTESFGGPYRGDARSRLSNYEQGVFFLDTQD